MVCKSLSSLSCSGAISCIWQWQDPPLGESSAHHRVVCELLRVQCLAHRYTISALTVSWHLPHDQNTFHILSAAELELRVLCHSAQSPTD